VAAAESPDVGHVLWLVPVGQCRQLVREDVLGGIQPAERRMVRHRTDSGGHVVDEFELEIHVG
jgi:hypothetical protein